MGSKNQEEKILEGLKYATSLNFTDKEYYEALKLIESPENRNQLLVALLEVSRTANSNDSDYTSNIIIDDKAQNRQSIIGPIIEDKCSIENGNQQSHQHNNSQQSRNYVSSNKYTSPESTTTTSTTTSCYSSTTSFPSSNNSSLESLQLRKIYIDGSNVARTHGKDRIFSWLGIKLCVDWFYFRQHKVKVFVPQDKCQSLFNVNNNNNSDKHYNHQTECIINYLYDIDALIRTPIGCNDDLFIIEAARQNNGIIVSNDLYRDEKRFNDELQNFIHLNRLPYVFVDDLFIPAEDPLGRTGPDLDEFLKETTSSTNINQNRFNYHHTKLSRTKSNQRYQRYSNSLNATANNNARSKTALYRTKSHNI